MNPAALRDLLYVIGDDLLIMGHRNSEWTGMGPLLEEDIAFSSMAQDKIGQSQALYQLLHEMGEPDPDTNAFMRNADAFRNCILVELPNGEYDFSLMRHFLFDTALAIRFASLRHSTHRPLADLARKVSAELRYHTLHAHTLIRRLGAGTAESIARLQNVLDIALPYARGIFEPSPGEEERTATGIAEAESLLEARWQEHVTQILAPTELRMPAWETAQPVYGGRRGQHSEHLQPLIDEMTEVFRSDPTTEW